MSLLPIHRLFYPFAALRPLTLSLSPQGQGDIYPLTSRASRARRPAPITHDVRTDDVQTTNLPLPQRTTTPARKQSTPPARKRHPIILIALGMVAALLIMFLWQFAGSWFSSTLDTLQYGNPRTYQIDTFVGHESGTTPSHFIAVNLHGRIEIVELPGNDSTHSRLYLGPQIYGPNADRIPVTLHFIDTRHDHHPDMYVQFGSTQIVFRNTPDGFKPA